MCYEMHANHKKTNMPKLRLNMDHFRAYYYNSILMCIFFTIDYAYHFLLLYIFKCSCTHTYIYKRLYMCALCCSISLIILPLLRLSSYFHTKILSKQFQINKQHKYVKVIWLNAEPFFEILLKCLSSRTTLTLHHFNYFLALIIWWNLTMSMLEALY